MNSKSLWFALTLLSLLIPAAAGAQTVYVTDKVLLGVYKERSQESELLKVLPTGTPLEILERDGSLARIREPSGIEGWVEASYLINEKPAQLLILELADKNKQAIEALDSAHARIEGLKQQLDKLKQNIANAPAAASDANAKKLKELQKRNAKLRDSVSSLKDQTRKLGKDRDRLAADLKQVRKDNSALKKKASARGKAASEKSVQELRQAQEKIAGLEAQLRQQEGGKDDIRTRLEKFEADYTVLQSRLHQAVALLTGQQQKPNAGTPAADSGGAVMPTKTAMVPEQWYVLGLVLALVFGFSVGVLWLDRRNMKRHGGFRV